MCKTIIGSCLTYCVHASPLISTKTAGRRLPQFRNLVMLVLFVVFVVVAAALICANTIKNKIFVIFLIFFARRRLKIFLFLVFVFSLMT